MNNKCKAKALLIIPAHNEQDNIENVINQIKQHCPEMDYVVVNDGSSDNTAELCKKNCYKMIDLPVNIGLGGAIQAGMRYAYLNDYDYAIQFDGDGQHDASYVRRMIEEAEEKEDGQTVDIIIGSRFVNETKPLNLRMVGSRVISFCIKLTTGKTIHDPTSGMRLYNRRAIKRLSSEMNLEPEPDTIAYLIRCGFNIEEIQVHMNERVAGDSYLNAINSIKYMAKICASILFVQWFRWKVR